MGRGAVRFGKYDVESDDRGTGLAEPGDQARHHVARPRPLPKPCEAFIIQIDEPDGRRVVQTRLQDLKQVEDLEPAVLENKRVGPAQSDAENQNGEGNYYMQPTPHGFIIIPNRNADNMFVGSATRQFGGGSVC